MDIPILSQNRYLDSQKRPMANWPTKERHWRRPQQERGEGLGQGGLPHGPIGGVPGGALAAGSQKVGRQLVAGRLEKICALRNRGKGCWVLFGAKIIHQVQFPRHIHRFGWYLVKPCLDPTRQGLNPFHVRHRMVEKSSAYHQAYKEAVEDRTGNLSTNSWMHSQVDSWMHIYILYRWTFHYRLYTWCTIIYR